jgi:hypothetical protein
LDIFSHMWNIDPVQIEANIMKNSSH